MFTLNLAAAGFGVFGAYSIIRFAGFRDALKEAIQDADTKFHWIDAKSFSSFVAGWFSAWFTMNVGGVLLYEKMFEVGPMAFLGIFITVTFTLWGIAWKK
jgi:hypothetical protein